MRYLGYIIIGCAVSFACMFSYGFNIRTTVYTKADTTINNSPLIQKNQNSSYSLKINDKPFLILGAQLWNSSAWPYLLKNEWPQLKELHCNTLEVPVYWQNIEKEENIFNFNNLDTIIEGARKQNLKLVLLWFGSFKNGSNQYIPEWMLTNPEKYPRMRNAAGKPITVLSAVEEANYKADANAFATLMKHLKQTDQQHTVIMIQVENESGSLGTNRDYSAKANKLFKQNVPSQLITQLGKKQGTWNEVFNSDAPEAFNAYYVARYIEYVTEAGKKEVDLPMYVNCWLRENSFQTPGEYPSGGPTSNMLDVWKAAAPGITLLAVDMYHKNYTVFNDVCQKYQRPDNPLFLPEMGNGIDFARFQFYAIGNYNAIGVATYGIDPFHADPNDERTVDKLDDKFSSIAANYKLLSGAVSEITKLQANGNLKAAGEEYGLKEQLVHMKGYDILLNYGYPTYKKSDELTGRVLIGQLGEDEFLLMGFDTKFTFRPSYGSTFTTAEYVSIEEGYYEGDKWITKRFWNGDEAYHSTLLPQGVILKIKLHKLY